MKDYILEKLLAQGLLSDDSYDKTKAQSSKKPVSLYLDLNLLLYIGVLLLCTGLGIAIYKNIDTIGHTIILLFILVISSGSFFYCLKKKLPFSRQKAGSPDTISDYILLLACLSFIILIGYAQHQYKTFGEDISLSLFITMLVLFFTAYYFDHAGILSLAITNLAAWAGVTISPNRILSANDLTNNHIIYIILILGIFLIICSIYSFHRNFKAHFASVYKNFGTHFLFISCLAGMMHFDSFNLIWLLMLACISLYVYRLAIKERSFYYLLIMTLYAYTGISYIICYWIFKLSNPVNLTCTYFIISAIAFILFLVQQNKRLKYDNL